VLGPDAQGGQFDEGQERGSGLVIARRHAPELLQLWDEALDAFACPVGLSVVLDWVAPALLGRDDGKGSAQEKVGAEVVRVIAVSAITRVRASGAPSSSSGTAVRSWRFPRLRQRQAEARMHRRGCGAWSRSRRASARARPLRFAAPL
jgi:hypothetical protein